MCTETGIKNVYQGVQGACPRRAVTHVGGTAERSERRAVGMGLKLVLRREGPMPGQGPLSLVSRSQPYKYHVCLF